MKHIVLMDGSIFDNGAYVGGGPIVIGQARSILPHDWQAKLLAADGNVCS